MKVLPLRNKKILSAYRGLFLGEDGLLTPQAELVFEDLYKFSRIFENSPKDPTDMALVEGSRSVVRHILKQIGAENREAVRQRRRHITGDDIYE